MQTDIDQLPLPETLTSAEMEPLWRWERQVNWLQASAMGALLAGAVVHRFGDLVWLRHALLGSMLALLGASAVLQFRGRCPRCQKRIRSKVMTALPDKCGKCGILFPRRPRADGSSG